jgi:TPR repeat protein
MRTILPFSPALLILGALFVGGCKGRGEASPSPSETQAASSEPPIELANAIGFCDDLEACERECDGGVAEQCRRIGVSYEFGKGGDASKNETQGTAYFDRSCELGSASGCVSSGQMHEYAHGVPTDMPKAAAAYEKACTIGWQVGCANFAIMLENGRGVPKDLVRARTLYEGACKAGAGLACERLKALAPHDGG